MNKLLTAYFTIFWIFLSLSSQTLENYEHRILTIKDGIPNTTLNEIYKDSRGYIWFGNTVNGLYRYDGYTFKDITFHYPDTFDYMASNAIWCIIEDKDSILWIEGFNGLFKLNPKESENKASRFIVRNENGEIEGFRPVSTIMEDHNGFLWMGVLNGWNVAIVNKRTKSFRYLILDPELSETSKNYGLNFCDMLQDVNNNVWILTDQGLYKYNYETEDINLYTFNSIKINDPSILILEIYENDSNSIWVSTSNGLFLFDKQKEKYIQPFIGYSPELKNEYKYIKGIQKDKAGKSWFRIKNDIYQIQSHKNKYVAEKIFSTHSVSIYEFYSQESFYIDDFNNMWFTSQGEGIHILKPKSNKFKILKYDPENKDGLFGFPYSVFEDNEGMLWIGSGEYTGLNKYNPKTKEFSHFLTGLWDNDNRAERITSIFQDSNGTLWIGTSGHGLYKKIITPDKQIRFKHYRYNPEDSASINSDWIYRIFEDEDFNLWIDVGSFNIDKYDRENDKFIHLSLEVDYINNAPDELKKVKGEIWFPSWKSIYRIIPPFTQISEHTIKAHKIIQYKPDENDPYSIKSVTLNKSFCFSSYYDPGTLWLGTKNGLVKMIMNWEEKKNEKFPQFTYLTKADGLSGNSIQGVLEDHYGNMWIGTDEGLSKYDPGNRLFSNYDFYDDIISNVFSGYCPHINKEGIIYFAIWGGIVIINSDSIHNTRKIPPIYITDFKLFDKSVHVIEDSPLKQTIGFTKEIELSYSQYSLGFEYVLLDYENAQRNLYRYKMEGLDRNWINAGTSRNANYSNLKHGKYIFRVQGVSSEGIWNIEGASLKIIIHPPPWKTVWAYLIYGFILIGIILWYRRFLLNRAKIRTALEVERVEREKVQELDKMKSRFFANISHEFRTPLTLILGPIEDFFKKKPLKVELSWDLLGIMHRNARRLQQLINQLLDISRLETGKVKLQVSEGNLEESVKTIIMSFISLAERKHIKYTYDLPGILQKVYYDSDKVEKILTNLISNAFKFTPANGKISVSLQYVTSAETEYPQFVNIKVSDTGKGIPGEKLNRIFDRFYQVSDSDARDAEGAGIGLALTRELVDLYRGEINVESNVGKGSTFKVRLPVSKEKFKEDEISEITPGKDVRKEPVDQEIVTEELELPDMKKSQIEKLQKETSVVLIVEDNIDLRNYILRNLGNSYQILTAENGKEGLDRALESIPELIISDVMMPVMDGMEMCRQLKTDERTNHIPVIMLTARADKGSKMEGLETGADDYIIKPFDADELRVRVRNLIEQRRRLREKFKKEFNSDTSDIEKLPQNQYLKKIMDILNNNLSESEFTINQLADELYMSRTQVFRKVKAITGYTPNDLLRNLRLRKAANLFRSGHNHVAQTMHQVGFNSQSYFGKCFKELYGMNPYEYIKHNNSEAAN